jgi:hypothetical protein
LRRKNDGYFAHWSFHRRGVVEVMASVTDMANDDGRGLAATVDANLPQCADAAGEQRYVQLVTLQAYARERLEPTVS